MHLTGQVKFFSLCKIITLRQRKIWPTFCRWHFHINSLVWKYFDSNFINVYSCIGPGNGLAPNKQTINGFITDEYMLGLIELISNITHWSSEILLSLPNYHLQWQCDLHVLQRQWNWKCRLIVVHNEQKGQGWNWTPLLLAMSMQIAMQISIFTALSCQGVGHLNCNAIRTVGNTSDKQLMSWPYQQVKFSKFCYVIYIETALPYIILNIYKAIKYSYLYLHFSIFTGIVNATCYRVNNFIHHSVTKLWKNSSM